VIITTAAIRTSTLLIVLLVQSPASQAEKPVAMTPTSIEIFATANQSISAIDTFVETHTDIGISVHKLDGIKGLVGELSEQLSTDPAKAKRQVLERLQRMNKGIRSQLEHSAMALAKAVQYGVEKYPAIVFDGNLVVYGLTDLTTALLQYRLWRAGGTS